MSKKVSIEFSNDEILVLSELLHRINSENILHDFFHDQAEERILWDLESALERNISSVINGDYLTDLHNARKNIRDSV